MVRIVVQRIEHAYEVTELHPSVIDCKMDHAYGELWDVHAECDR